MADAPIGPAVPVGIPTGTQQPTSQQAIDAADKAVTEAQKKVESAGTEVKRLSDLLQGGTIAATDPASQQENPEYRRTVDQLKAALDSYNAASREHASALDRAAQVRLSAAEKADPQTKATLSAQAGVYSAQADDLRAQTSLRGAQTDAQKQEAQAAADNAHANLNNAQTNATRVGAETPLLTAQASQANAQAGFITGAQTALTNAQAGLVGAQTGLVGAQTANTQAQTRLTDAQVTQVQATAGLTQAQADAIKQKTPTEILQLQGQIGLTDAQAKSVLNGMGLTDAQIDSVRETTTKGKLGGLYGIDDQIAKIKDLMAKGSIKPDEGDAMLHDYVTSAVGGTSPYQAFTQQQTGQTERTGQELTQRGQDVGTLNQRIGTLGSMANQAMGTIGQMNQYATPGSNAGAGALLSLMGIDRGMLGGDKGFQPPPPVQVPAYPSFLDRYGGGAGGAAPAPQMPAPAPAQAAAPPGPGPAATGAGTVTINIGPPPAPNPTAEGIAQGMANTGGQFATSGATPAYLDNKGPATPQDVMSMYPEAAQRVLGNNPTAASITQGFANTGGQFATAGGAG